MHSTGPLCLPVQLWERTGEAPREVVLSQESGHTDLDVWNGAQKHDGVGDGVNDDMCNSLVLLVT